MIERIDTRDEILDTDTLGFYVTGNVTREEYKQHIPTIEQKIDFHGKINLYCEVEAVNHVELQAVLEDFKMYFKHFRDFEKIAIITNNDALTKTIVIGEYISSARIKTFTCSQKELALEWVYEKEPMLSA